MYDSNNPAGTLASGGTVTQVCQSVVTDSSGREWTVPVPVRVTTTASETTGGCFFRYTREGFHLEIPADGDISIRHEDGKVVIVGVVPYQAPACAPASSAPSALTSAVPQLARGMLAVRLSAAQKERIVALFDGGMTNKSQIGRVVGTTFHTVLRILERAGRILPAVEQSTSRNPTPTASPEHLCRRPSIQPRRLSAEQKDQIVALFDGGMTSPAQIGRAVGTTSTTAYKYLSAAGRVDPTKLSGRGITESQRDQVLALYDGGMTNKAEISRQVGCDVQAVYKLLNGRQQKEARAASAESPETGE